MKRTLKRIKMAWLILFSKRKIVALAYRDGAEEIFLNVTPDELQHLVNGVQNAIDKREQDVAIQAVNHILCLN